MDRPRADPGIRVNRSSPGASTGSADLRVRGLRLGHRPLAPGPRRRLLGAGAVEPGPHHGVERAGRGTRVAALWAVDGQAGETVLLAVGAAHVPVGVREHV